MQILLPCSKAAPDMAFGFVDIKHLPGFCRQGRIHLPQTLRHILMCGRDDFELFYFQQIHLRSIPFHPVPDLPEVSGKCPRFRPCPPHCGLVLDDIVCDLHRPLFNIILQEKSPCTSCFYNLCRGKGSHAHLLRKVSRSLLFYIRGTSWQSVSAYLLERLSSLQITF